jgi:hypothetical protein
LRNFKKKTKHSKLKTNNSKNNKSLSFNNNWQISLQNLL